MIRFSKYIVFYFILSGLFLVPGIFFLIQNGLLPAVDFTGGTLLQIHYQKHEDQSVVDTLLSKQQIVAASIQSTGVSDYIIRLKPQTNEKLVTLEQTIVTAGPKATIVSNDTIGPVLGKELLQKTVAAAIFATLAILAYVAWAFKNFKFGVSAILALFHDCLMVVGIFAMIGVFYHIEVDTLFVTAFLTTMSFSAHDTIVVFDRIRELLKRGERGTFEDLCDRALTETIGRSLANTLTIVFMLLALFLLGGETVKWFIFALLVGTISGAYSSPFVATPILILWDRWEKRKK